MSNDRKYAGLQRVDSAAAMFAQELYAGHSVAVFPELRTLVQQAFLQGWAAREPERIVSVAILVDNEVWQLPRPARHMHVIAAYISVHGKELGRPYREQGFVTDRGRYVSREEAAAIAWDAEQTRCRHLSLTSEALW